jgi:hypothetical protein
MLKLNERQHQFIEHICNISTWHTPGYDRFRITHRTDGKIQMSWKYMNRADVVPYTTVSENGFIYVGKEDLIKISDCISTVIVNNGTCIII